MKHFIASTACSLKYDGLHMMESKMYKLSELSGSAALSTLKKLKSEVYFCLLRIFAL